MLPDENTRKTSSQLIPNCSQMKIHVNSHYNHFQIVENTCKFSYNNCFQTKMHEKSNSKLLPDENTRNISLQSLPNCCNENLHVFSSGSNLELIVMRCFVYFQLESDCDEIFRVFSIGKWLWWEFTCIFIWKQFGSNYNENLHVFSSGNNLEVIVMRIYMYFHLGAIWN